MGWWSTNKAGHSFASEPDDQPEMFWGDSVADHMDDALDKIVREFYDEVGRHPTKDEIRAGLEFSISIWE